MKIYRYNEPIFGSEGAVIGNEIISKTREQILAEYFPSWQARMQEKGLVGTEEQCVEDFIIVNWAWEDDV